MRKTIPYGRQSVSNEDVEAVVEVLRSDFLTQGPRIIEFEKAFAEYTNARYAVAVSNGTAALHLSVIAMGVKPGDKVITTPLTFVASANCVKYADGQVVFADVDPETYLLDVNKVEELLKSSPKGTYKGIIPVDLAGRPVNMEAFRLLANKYECWIIEDACHAPGGFFKDRKEQKQICGNGIYSDLAIFSFHPVKHIASGEGGMITTNDESLYKKLLTLRTHGITKNPVDLKENHGGWYYEMQYLGYNYRLSDIQAALGNSQLKKADEGLKRRREIAEKYFTNFKGNPFIVGQSGVVDGHAYHLYIIEVEKRDELYEYLKANNIFAQIHYIPLHLMPYYRQFGWEYGDFPVAENYYKRCLSLPMFPTLTNQEQTFVIDCINSFFDGLK